MTSAQKSAPLQCVWERTLHTQPFAPLAASACVCVCFGMFAYLGHERLLRESCTAEGRPRAGSTDKYDVLIQNTIRTNYFVNFLICMMV